MNFGFQIHIIKHEIHKDHTKIILYSCGFNQICRYQKKLVGFMVFNATFNYNVAVSFIGGGNQWTQRKPPTCRKSLTNFITWCCTHPPDRFELTSVVIGTDCIGSCKSNYHKITATGAPQKKCLIYLTKRLNVELLVFLAAILDCWST